MKKKNIKKLDFCRLHTASARVLTTIGRCQTISRLSSRQTKERSVSIKIDLTTSFYKFFRTINFYKQGGRTALCISKYF